MRKPSRTNILCAFVPLVLLSCASLVLPKGYVPDDKVVFLREKLEFGPIRYKAMTVDPYAIAADSGTVQTTAPSFLSLARFDELLKPDFAADSRLYREVETHLAYVKSLPDYLALRARLEAASIVAPPPPPPDHGEKVKDYTNGAAYNFPGEERAIITILSDGSYYIDYPDGGSFKYFPDGSYAREDGAGAVIFAFNKAGNSVTLRDGDAVFESAKAFRRITTPQGRVEYSSSPEPQYHFEIAAGSAKRLYTFFVGDGAATAERSVTNAAGIRFDYLPDTKTVLVSQGSRSIVLDPDFDKQERSFDRAKNQTTDLLSVFSPEGLRMQNLQSPDLSFADLNPAWPLGLQAKNLGPYRVLYAAKDEDLLSRLDLRRMTEIEAMDRRITGLAAMQMRTIVIPPDLESYCRLAATKPGSLLAWYPSGFETKDFIVMWPLSVPRYDEPAGQDYFFHQELYEILAHEYVHLLVGENSGLLAPVPVWLNEGLAVYTESQVSADCRSYWDLTFTVSRDRRSLLDWDEAALHSTGEFPADKARVQYAQSYALVNALVTKYGIGKVDEYVKSFRVKPEELSKVDLRSDYRAKFKKIFGIGFDEAVRLLLNT